MPQLKRKRIRSDPDRIHSTSFTNAPYFDGLPDGLAELSDVNLLVEEYELPAHIYVLSKSPILLAAISAAADDRQRICQLPLPGDSGL